VQDLLGDLIPKEEKYGSKQGMFPTKGERFPRRKSIFQSYLSSKVLRPSDSNMHLSSIYYN